MSDVYDEEKLDDDDENVEGSNAALSSWRKLRKRVSKSHFGSVLHRNSVRGDHLRNLFVKRRIKEAMINSMSVNEVHNATRLSQHIPQSFSGGEQGYELSMNPAAMAMMEKFDETFIEDMKAEIEKEIVEEPAIIQELNSIAKEYKEIMNGYNEFPLEVRLKNFSYIVPLDRKSSKIMTVYTASCVYPIAIHLKRFLLGEPKKEREVHTKAVLRDINLVLKPGKQYLVLGPPGSGKSTLLQAIAGLVHPTKYEQIEGTISYNGRTLAVRSLFVQWCTPFFDGVTRNLNVTVASCCRNRMNFISKMPLHILIN
jgi:ABC-type multidrug transport system fused ATPase/permease subunit